MEKRAEMKKLFLDTDIGADCDDASALELLLQLEKEGKCFLEGISCSTLREGASATAKVICEYLGFSKPVGKMIGRTDSTDTRNYGIRTKNKYGYEDSEITSVEVFRSILSESSDKIDIIAIGPLSTIKDFLKSKSDKYSPCDGIELIGKKAGTLYIQGGSFAENCKIGGRDPEKISYEYNLREDVEAAKYVLENYPNEIIFCPYEAGEKVYTYTPKTKSPVRFANECCAEILGLEEFINSSWDPQTCLFAVEDCSEFFTLSPYGVVSLENGKTVFKEQYGGKHRYLLLKENYRDVEKRINEIILKMEESMSN